MDLTDQIAAALDALIARGMTPNSNSEVFAALVVAQSLNRIADALEAGGGAQGLPAPSATPAAPKVAPEDRWITDRVPKWADADADGDVLVRNRLTSGGKLRLHVNFMAVYPGTPWWPCC